MTIAAPPAERVRRVAAFPPSCSAARRFDQPGNLFLWFPSEDHFAGTLPLMRRLADRLDVLLEDRCVVLSLDAYEAPAAFDCLGTLLDRDTRESIETLFVPGKDDVRVFDFTQVCSLETYLHRP